MACAVGCPVIGVYGPTDPLVNVPWAGDYRCIFPDGRRYTGIKRRDRALGFTGIAPAQLDDALDALLGERTRELGSDGSTLAATRMRAASAGVP